MQFGASVSWIPSGAQPRVLKKLMSDGSPLLKRIFVKRTSVLKNLLLLASARALTPVSGYWHEAQDEILRQLNAMNAIGLGISGGVTPVERATRERLWAILSSTTKRRRL